MTVLPQEYDVSGKKVLITGAGRGIGKGIALVLADAGAELAINALTPKYVGPLVAELNAAGHKAVSVLADATDARDAERMIGEAVHKLGHLDVLINNVGDAVLKPLVPRPGKVPTEAMTDEELRYQIDINLMHAVHCSRAVGPHFFERGHGKVINISSIWSRKAPRRPMAVNASAKAALNMFTQALALEWAPYQITVNCIAPGLFPDIVTVGKEGMQEFVDRAKAEVPLGRHGQLREVGLLALYLVSDASRFMTGQVLFLDGGQSL